MNSGHQPPMLRRELDAFRRRQLLPKGEEINADEALGEEILPLLQLAHCANGGRANWQAARDCGEGVGLALDAARPARRAELEHHTWPQEDDIAPQGGALPRPVRDAVARGEGRQGRLPEGGGLLDAAAEVVAVVVQVADAPRVLAVAQQYRLAVIAVADTLGAALGLVDLGRNADAPRCAVVFDHPNYAVPVAEQLAHCLQQLAGGAEPNPRCLREPFADAPVAPRERELLALEVEGLSQRAMAERLVVVEGTIRVYLTRLRERLELPNAASIRAWAEAWWFAHHDVGRAVGQ